MPINTVMALSTRAHLVRNTKTRFPRFVHDVVALPGHAVIYEFLQVRDCIFDTFPVCAIVRVQPS